ncbi:YD repeat-containing protein [Alteromonadaceae bacterium Bs31]|nr:YD repeat-containing protein [Alteromonadaceae bacterium Bs31]
MPDAEKPEAFGAVMVVLLRLDWNIYFRADSSGLAVTTSAAKGNSQVCNQPNNAYWTLEASASGPRGYTCLDALGRAIRKAAPSFDGSKWILVDTEYDKLVRVILTSIPFLQGSSLGAQDWTENADVDVLGRAGSIYQPVREDGERPRTQFTYIDNIKTISNAKQLVRRAVSNALGQVVRVKDPLKGETDFYFDASGNLRLMKDPVGNQTSIGYNLVGRKTSMSDPDKGNLGYNYNAFGELNWRVYGTALPCAVVRNTANQ